MKRILIRPKFAGVIALAILLALIGNVLISGILLKAHYHSENDTGISPMWIFVAIQWVSLGLAALVPRFQFDLNESSDGQNSLFGSYPLDGYGKRETENFYAISSYIRKRGSVTRAASSSDLLKRFARRMSDDPVKTFDRLLFLERLQEHEARRVSSEGASDKYQEQMDEHVVRILDARD